MTEQRYRSVHWSAKGIERMSAIRQHGDDVHFRTQVDKIAWLLAARVPEEGTVCIDRDRREKCHAWRAVPQAQPDPGRRGQKIFMCVARGRSEGGERRSRGRASDHQVVRAAGILDKRYKYPPHVR